MLREKSRRLGENALQNKEREENKMAVHTLTEEEISALLEKAPYGHLALCREGQPYVIPLNYVYHAGRIYFHSGRKGRKIDYLQANNRVCFQVAAYGDLVVGSRPCQFNYRYRSIIAEGDLHEAVEEGEKLAVLQAFAVKYGGAQFSGAKIAPADISRTAVFYLTPRTVSGKKND